MVECQPCGRREVVDPGEIARRHGDRTLGQAVEGLRCQGCGARPTFVGLLTKCDQFRLPLFLAGDETLA